MIDPFRTCITGPGVWQIASLDPLSWGAYGVLVQLQPDASWGGGQLVLANVVLADGQFPSTGIPASALTTVPFTDLLSGYALPAGQPVGPSATVIVASPSIYSLYATVPNYSAGTLLVIVTPYNQAPANTVNFSNVNIDSVPPWFDDDFELRMALNDAGQISE